jgi:murein L,D-transpeptidase YafK
LIRSSSARAVLASVAIAAAIALGGCDTDNADPSLALKALKPISPKTMSEIAEKNMTKESPILVRLFKQESELEVWKQDNTGQFALLKTFPICRWSGDLGPKVKEGDRQAPEGFYNLTQANMNPSSQYYLAFNIGFPNTYDRANDRTGNFLMIHGDCSSRGCYAMTDEQIAEIYALARESFFGGQRSFQIQAYPFRMTPVNMAKHRGNPNMPFWRMLKEGYDHFEVTRQEPKIDVCEKRYVFNAGAPAGGASPKFSPRAQCPIYEVPAEIASAVAEKKKKDDFQIAQLIGRGTPAAPIKMATDGGMHEVFATALQGGRAVRGTDGDIARIITPSSSLPGTIPSTVNPPSNVLMAAAPPVVAAPAAPPAAVAQPASPPRSNTIMANAPAAQPAARPAQAASVAQPKQTAAAAVPGVDATKKFLGSLFTAKDKQPQTQTASAAPTAPAPAAKPIDLRGSSAAVPRPLGLPPAKPKTTAVAEAKPMPLPEPEEAAPRAAKPGAIRQPSSVSAFNGPPQANNGGLLSGAAPVIPSGSFGSAWR